MPRSRGEIILFLAFFGNVHIPPRWVDLSVWQRGRRCHSFAFWDCLNMARPRLLNSRFSSEVMKPWIFQWPWLRIRFIGGTYPIYVEGLFCSGLNFREYPQNIWPKIWYVYVPPCIGSWVIPIEYLGQPPIPWDLGAKHWWDVLDLLGAHFSMRMRFCYIPSGLIWFSYGLLMGW